jgi:hypothetical protein
MIDLFGQFCAVEDRGLCELKVEDGRIVAIRPAIAARPDATGHPGVRIVPGLLVIQLDGAFAQDFGDPSTDMAWVCWELPRFGVYGIRADHRDLGDAAHEAASLDLADRFRRPSNSVGTTKAGAVRWERQPTRPRQSHQ